MSAIAATEGLRLQPTARPTTWGGEQALGVNELVRPPGAAKPEQAREPGETSFAELLGASVEQAAMLGNAAGGQADAFARGALDDLHGTLIAAKEAEISLKLVGSVRNKLLDAFQELWRISV